MKIFYHKKFDKRFEKLTFKLQNKVIETIKLFQKNPTDPILKNHALKGKMNNMRAVSVTGNIRIIFEEHNNYALIIVLDIGTHNQTYV